MNSFALKSSSFLRSKNAKSFIYNRYDSSFRQNSIFFHFGALPQPLGGVPFGAGAVREPPSTTLIGYHKRVPLSREKCGRQEGAD